jgi:hypothetical protein
MSGTLLTGPQPVFTKKTTGYRTVAIRPGDGPERIAQRELGDASLWYDIVALNGLRWPWITDDPAVAVPGVVLLSIQDTILVPSTAPDATAVAASPDVFGRDCLLTNGQISANPEGDIQTVGGPDNLAQAISLRLETHPGELVYHPDYGNRAYLLLGRANTPIADALAASWVASSVASDPRVASTEQMKASTQGDVLSVTGVAIAVDGKRLPIGLPGRN